MKYNYMILQSDNRDYTFMNFRWALNNGFKISDYKAVYARTIEADTVDDALNKLWKIFNINHPADYKGRSLSMSDVVMIDGVPYYCDNFGWSEVPADRLN